MLELLVTLTAAALHFAPASRGANTVDSTERTAWGRGHVLRAAAAAAASFIAQPRAGLAEDYPDKTVGEIAASGLIFKDVIKVQRFSDPKVQGVSLYVSDFQRPLTERLAKDFFSDPTQAAVTCVRTGPIALDPSIDKTTAGEEVFSQARALLFKSIKVRRIYDEETGALVYVSYSERLNKNDDENKARYKSTICALGTK